MSKPLNVLWILCDELRADALGCYGNAQPGIATPNIDRLADSGVLFENTGVYGNEAQSGDYAVLPTGPAFTELLAASRWVTRDHGKEHVPDSRAPWQAQDPAGGSMADLAQDAAAVGAPMLSTPGIGHAVAAGPPAGSAFSAGQVTEHTRTTLARLAGSPFVVRASYLQPHTPVVVPEPWASQYDDLDFPPGPGEPGRLSESEFGRVNRGEEMSGEDVQRVRRLYYASVAWVDAQVARLLDTLEELGLRESTLVVLTADHGAYLGEDGGFGNTPSRRRATACRCSCPLPPGSCAVSAAQTVPPGWILLVLCCDSVASARSWIEGRDLFTAPAPGHLVSVIGYGATPSRAFPKLDAGRWRGASGWPQGLCVRTERYRLDLNTRIDGRRPRTEKRDLFLADRLVDPRERWNVADERAYADVLAELFRVVVEAAADRLVVPGDDDVYCAFTLPAPVREESAL